MEAGELALFEGGFQRLFVHVLLHLEEGVAELLGEVLDGEHDLGPGLALVGLQGGRGVGELQDAVGQLAGLPFSGEELVAVVGGVLLDGFLEEGDALVGGVQVGTSLEGVLDLLDGCLLFPGELGLGGGEAVAVAIEMM